MRAERRRGEARTRMRGRKDENEIWVGEEGCAGRRGGGRVWGVRGE